MKATREQRRERKHCQQVFRDQGWMWRWGVGDEGDKERGVSLSKCSKTKMREMTICQLYVNKICILKKTREMKLNAIMSSQRGEKIYQFNRKISQLNSWQIISTLMSENFIIFLKALRICFLHSTSATKEINNPPLWDQLIMAPNNL